MANRPRAGGAHIVAPWWGVWLTLALAACATVPQDERLLTLRPDGDVMASTQPCGVVRPAQAIPTSQHDDALDTRLLRIASWNLHKGEDTGWEADLAQVAAEHDLLLLQEAVLSVPMRGVLERAGYSWRMAGAFAYDGQERGVLVAARMRPLDTCTLRAFEPLFPLPKSAIVARYRLAPSNATLAVANLHGVNFTLAIGGFRAQLEAVAAELARHDGPAILGGDFNTWSAERHEVLNAIASQLGMQPVLLEPDGRRRAFGLHLDHLFVRGFTVVRAHAPEVKSSDHNPILIILTAK